MKQSLLQRITELFFCIIVTLVLLPFSMYQTAAASVPIPKFVVAPSDFKAVLGSNATVTFTWNDNSNNEEYYRIQYKTNNNNNYDDLVFAYADETTKTFTFPTYMFASQPFTFRIQGYNTSYGYSSNSIEVTVSLLEPLKPELQVSLNPDQSVQLSWTESTPERVDYYRVKRKTAGELYSNISVVNSTQNGYTDKTVTPGTYSYTIETIGFIGSSLSTEKTITVSLASKPQAPSNLAVTLSGNAVHLTWSDHSENETGFYIERQQHGSGYSPITTTPSNTTYYDDTSLTKGETYTYRVYSSNSSGNSGYSNLASIYIPNSDQQPNQIYMLDYFSANSWAVEELQKAEEYSLVTNKVLTNLQQDITREEFCSIAVLLYQALTSEQVTPSLTNPFKDTSDMYVLEAFKLGIVKGITDDRFAPNSSISRQEICIMLYRALNAAKPNMDFNVSGVNKFADEHLIADWAINEVRYVAKHNIMKGIGNNTINPLEYTSREEGIVFVKRTYESFVNK
ncbi:MAG: hypothetical protein CVU84_16380 [Firmicutes bacterium HGW-Firmicutes-1]|jgi:hypothetical protein|nr:MAG: hypothetical protein CVU84_16380 [Firmicutes bacterium HGW-Firmicutes-1]